MAQALAFQREAERQLVRRRPERPLHANVEFYAAVVMEQCGIPSAMFTPTFALARTAADVERIFKAGEIARNGFTLDGRPIDIGKIRNVAVMTVEGANDDISAPGQCVAALALCTGLPESKKAQHLEPGAGHYGIFAGKSWRLNIRPLVLDFMDEHSTRPEQSSRPKRQRGITGPGDTRAPGPEEQDSKIAV